MTKPYELFEAAFRKENKRTPRSREYKAGVLALLRRQIEGTPLRCPWDEGTAAFDAFYSGVEEGWTIYGKYVQANRVSIKNVHARNPTP